MDPLSDWIERYEALLGFKFLDAWQWLLERIGRHGK